MNKYFLIVIVAVVVIVSGFVIGFKLMAGHEVSEITLTFTENGFNQNVSDVRVKGGTANVTYHIINKTGQTITPVLDTVFDVNPDAYSVIEGQGYSVHKASQYITVSGVAPIENGNSAKLNVMLDIPKSELAAAPDKWAFITIAASNTGGFVQVAPYVWWIITMR